MSYDIMQWLAKVGDFLKDGLEYALLIGFGGILFASIVGAIVMIVKLLS